MDRFKDAIRYILRLALITVAILPLGAAPAYALNNTNPMLADPGRYFPGCACQATFLSFVIWMIALLIIAMFQYGEPRKRKLSAYWFSIIAIILAFIIYSIPLVALSLLLKPESFQVNQETGKYEFSQYGEKDELTGSYTKAEVDDHILKSRTGIYTSWAILAIACVGAGASIPAYLKRRAKKKPLPVRKKRKSKGRIGTRVTKPAAGKEKKDKKK